MPSEPRFLGEGVVGVADNYIEFEGSHLKRVFLEREINTLTVNRSTEHTILSHLDRGELRRPAMKHL